ncbi:hypothetical protein EVJ32_04655 [Exiguobacterium sp. SH5S4]|uniref:hypothetical protein n=1 Tax=Exiguobacterium sp. SH5S4 TaxID=2510961 RepID=UPI001039078A|nr:hypothetical protein [Exiguobacterium sp. SH5S4]TCI26668.1 hypothetical protein EVJ32_04655 [Exiguobacterium sp. SH5S4]
METAKRISLTQWNTILNNLEEQNEEVEIVWLDSGDEWCLCNDCELFEDGFKDEDEASHRLYMVTNATAKGIYYYDPQDGRENAPLDTFKLVDVYDNGTLLIFNVLDGHNEVKKEYVETCQAITKERYEEINKSWFR